MLRIAEKLATAKNAERLKKQIANFYFTTAENVQMLNGGRVVVNNKQMQGTRWADYKNGFLFYIPENPLY